MIDLILVITLAGMFLFCYFITLHLGCFLETIQDETTEMQCRGIQADRIKENHPEEKKA